VVVEEVVVVVTRVGGGGQQQQQQQQQRVDSAPVGLRVERVGDRGLGVRGDEQLGLTSLDDGTDLQRRVSEDV